MERENIVKILEEYAGKFKEGERVALKDVQPLVDTLKRLVEEGKGDVSFYANWVLSMMDAGKIDADIRRYILKIAKMLKLILGKP
jgi:hypothetical protein